MGIKLLPPDVNESGAHFTVSGSNIRYGLVAIKGMGWGAVDGLVAERERGGLFQSFEDFCRRMNGSELNRRAVDNLKRPARSTPWAISAARSYKSPVR